MKKYRKRRRKVEILADPTVRITISCGESVLRRIKEVATETRSSLSGTIVDIISSNADKLKIFPDELGLEDLKFLLAIVETMCVSMKSSELFVLLERHNKAKDPS